MGDFKKDLVIPDGKGGAKVFPYGREEQQRAERVLEILKEEMD